MFELVFLGTSASAPSVRRGLSSAIVMSGEHRFMIDCGEGTQRQLLRSGLGFRRLDRILLTHGHLDHILGLGGLASTLGRWEALEELNIYGGASAIARVRALMEVVFGAAHVDRVGITLNVLEEGVTFEAKSFTVTAFPVQHRGDGCFGFLFEEKARRPFLADKAEALGIPHGPVRRTLAQGETALLSGRAHHRRGRGAGSCATGREALFRGRRQPHWAAAQDRRGGGPARDRSHLFGGRQGPCQTARPHHRRRWRRDWLATPGVKQLVLHHVSRRYPTHEIVAEARAVFPDTVVADDLDIVRVTKDKPAQFDSLRGR